MSRMFLLQLRHVKFEKLSCDPTYDILEMEGVRRSEKLLRLLQLLAFQVGHDVSIDSLGRELGISKNTAARYLDLLEKAFVIYNRAGFSRNLRKEIFKSRRYYFFRQRRQERRHRQLLAARAARRQGRALGKLHLRRTNQTQPRP